MKRSLRGMPAWFLMLALVSAATAAQALERRYSLEPGSRLHVSMKYGALRIVGGSGEGIVVKIVNSRTSSEEEAWRRLRVRFQSATARRPARLEISGLRNPEVEVLVPAQVHLRAGLRAGELSVEGVHGDLEARVFAGELSVKVPDRALYKTVHARVRIGDLSHPFAGSGRGWLGRRFTGRYTAGRYRLDASVAVGDVHIKEDKVI